MISAPFNHRPAPALGGELVSPDLLSRRLEQKKIFHALDRSNEESKLSAQPKRCRDIISQYANLHLSLINTFETKRRALVLGGDHSICVSSVSAAHDHCMCLGERLGVLWCNITFDPSASQEISMMSVLLGDDTTPSLRFGRTRVLPFQIAYLDHQSRSDSAECEFARISTENFQAWEQRFDRLYVIFEIETCAQPRPRDDGALKEAYEVFDLISQSRKLMGGDFVGYDALRKDESLDLCADLISHLFSPDT